MSRPHRLRRTAVALAGLGAFGAAVPLGASERPGGGASVLPQHRVIGLYGAPQAPQLGELGIGSPQRAARVLRRQIRPYKPLIDRPIVGAFELIATIALADPGPDGKYRARQPDRIIRRNARVANREDFLLLLDIQPGRSTFIEEVRRLRPWLRKPFVSVALDPEWNMGPSGVPGQRIGSVGAGMVNRVTRFMARVIRRQDLPEKLVVVHQFTESMIRNKGKLKRRPAIDLVLNADGFGTPAAKRSKYRQLAPRPRRGRYPGFKLFYHEDTDLMSPREVMRLSPRPRFVVYE